jgi:hypothetical protein
MLVQLPRSVEGRGPSLSTLVEVAQILEAASGEPPLSLAEVGRRMSAKRVRHSTLRATVDFLASLGFVTTGSKGAQWTLVRDRKFWTAARKARSLSEV